MRSRAQSSRWSCPRSLAAFRRSRVRIPRPVLPPHSTAWLAVALAASVRARAPFRALKCHSALFVFAHRLCAGPATLAAAAMGARFTDELGFPRTVSTSVSELQQPGTRVVPLFA